MNNHIQTVMDADINMHNSVLLSTDINSIKGTRIELFWLRCLFLDSTCLGHFFGWRTEPHFSPNHQNATRSGSEMSQLYFKGKNQIRTLIPYLTENTHKSDVSNTFGVFW